jgi:hypothetical protein
VVAALAARCRCVGRLLLVACVRGAAAGEELCISYGPQAGVHSTAQRQAVLRELYGFGCTCPSCMRGAKGAGGVAEEALLQGLACCSGSGCSGALLAPAQLPDGVVSQQQQQQQQGLDSSAAGRARQPAAGTQRQPHVLTCCSCGWQMPRSMLQQTLLDLQAAAERAQQGTRYMQSVAGAIAQLTAAAQQPQQQQQLQLLNGVEQAVQQLADAARTRQRHLAAGSLLLGQSHHQAAAAAVEAATLALAAPAAAAAAAAAAGDGACPCLDSMQQAVQLLRHSMAMHCEQEVLSVLGRAAAQLQLVAGQAGAAAAAAAATDACSPAPAVCDAPAAALAALDAAACMCTCIPKQQQQQQQQHGVPSVGRLSLQDDDHTQQQQRQQQQQQQQQQQRVMRHLQTAATHLLRSVQVLWASAGAHKDCSSLQLAAEAAACSAACGALLACRDVGAHGAARAAAAAASAGSRLCAGCAVLRDVAVQLHVHAATAFRMHMPEHWV